MSEEINVSALEEDILKEIINIGLAKVADSFAVMARQPVLLDVPEMDILHLKELDTVLPESETQDTVIDSDIKGEIEAKALLIFKEMQANKLADLCIGAEKSYEGNYSAMKKSLLLETSNILTGALVTQFANIFNMQLMGMPPVAVPYRQRKSFSELIASLVHYKPIVLTVKTHFLNTGKEVELPMVLVFDIQSMLKILAIIRKRNKQDANWLAHRE